MLNNIAVSKMKKVTRWAGKNPKLSLSLVVLIQIFILFYGLGLGAILYAHDFYLPLFTFATMVGVGVGVGVGVVGAFFFRRANQYLRYLGFILGIFFFSIHIGYNELNPDNYTAVDFMYSYAEQIDASANQKYASISYKTEPQKNATGKGGKEKSKYSKRQMRKQQWKKDIKNWSNSLLRHFLIALLTIFCVLLGLISIFLFTMAWSPSGVVFIIMGLFFSLLTITLAVFLFGEAMNKKAIKERKVKEENKKEERKKKTKETEWGKEW